MNRRPLRSRLRLAVPEDAPAALGCDAVGVPHHLGYQLMPRLPHAGCVFADCSRWWWIVPSGSDAGLVWPPAADYAPDAAVSIATLDLATALMLPRLVHRPTDGVPYTPPIPLYLLLCRLTGTTPAWSWDVAAAAVHRNAA